MPDLGEPTPHTGFVTHEAMEHELYAQFDQRRRAIDAQAADAQDMENLRALEQHIKDKKA